MVDPTSDLGEDVTEENAPRCATCGSSIVNDPNHRVLTWIEDNAVQSRHFCNEGCREQWDPEN
ncbi:MULTISPECIES: hypothetical protein [unclassified Haladaptatus]|uniref:DUF7576 family protein n=1 Tax=unclassified Haladaptatus TaxID=2622732 RepID=UPI0023E83B89|nr:MULTISPECIES: hypothetical protein [unclassified Haladaptatus]